VWLLNIHSTRELLALTQGHSNFCGRLCETLTTAKVDELSTGEREGFPEVFSSCDTTKLIDMIKYCNTTPYTDTNGHTGSVLAFTYVDCTTNALLLMSVQVKAYSYPGVSTWHPTVTF
jgi:hypothetical protein